jgi:X-Pro dipeptidyl-peptidase
VPRKLWLHGGGHGGPQGATVAAYRRTQDRWFDHELFGVPNGVEAEPRLTIEREDGSLASEADWPAPPSCPGRTRPTRTGSCIGRPCWRATSG